MERFTWENIRANIYAEKLDSRMLRPEGWVLPTRQKMKGESNATPSMVREIFYNRDYVFAWFVKKVFFPLRDLTKDELLQTIEELYDQWKFQTQAPEKN